MQVIMGAAECATTQTVQVADSVPSRCRCAANSSAEAKADTIHNQVMHFEIVRIRMSMECRFFESILNSSRNATCKGSSIHSLITEL